jgi:hypothetical protein
VCRSCKKRVYGRYSGMKGDLKNDSNFQCSVCIMSDHRYAGHDKKAADDDDASSVEWVDSFCYLGDMTGSGGEWRMR